MDAREMLEIPDAEVAEHIRKLRRDLVGLRFSNATGELEDTASLRRTKRDLARALTVARERELGIARAG